MPMKGLITSICYLSLMIWSLAMVQPAQAGSLLGGHIKWDSTGKDTFEVKVVVYKDCSKQPSAVPPDLTVGCKTGRLSGAKTTLLSYNGGKTITSTCDSLCGKCQSPNCSFANSVEKHVATYLVALNKVSCCRIRFSHKGGKRSSRLENGLANDSLYLESWMNQCAVGCQTSVQFRQDLSPIICKNQNVRKSLGIFNGNSRDSFRYYWARPWSSKTDPISFKFPLTYDLPFFFRGFPNAYFPAPLGLHLDEQYGDLRFTSRDTIVSSMTYETEKFCNNKLVGKIRRDIPIITVNCNNNRDPDVTGFNYKRKQTISVCAGQSRSWNFCTSDPDKGDTVTLSLAQGALPSSIAWVNSNNQKRLATGNLTWNIQQSQARPEPYDFSIKASDDNCPINGTVEKELSIRVRAKPPPSGTYTVKKRPCRTIELTTQTTSGNPDYKLEIQDTTYLNGSTFTHQFEKDGTYPFRLVLTDQNTQCQRVYRDSVTINSSTGPPVLSAGFRIDSVINACGAVTLQIRDTATQATDYQYQLRHTSWVDSIREDTLPDPSFQLKQTGTYIIKQIADNPYCTADTATITDSIYIEQKPEAAIQLKDTSGCLPLRLELNDRSRYDSLEKGSAQWQLDPIADTSGQYQLQVQGGRDTTLKLTDSGYYQVTLLAFNNQGCVDTAVRDSSVYVQPFPEARADKGLEAVCPEEPIAFQNRSRFYDSSKWMFGDGERSAVANPNHRYQQSGSYDVTLAVSEHNCWDTTTYDSLVQVYSTPAAGFTTSFGKACTPLEVTIASEASGQVDSHFYDFDNGFSTDIRNPTITFNREDSFTIRQEVFNDKGCRAADSLQLAVYESPDANYTVADSQVFCHEKAYKLANLSSPEQPNLKDSLLYQWAFGVPEDSVVTKNKAEPVKRYAKEGDYPVELVATNGLCKDSLKKLLKVRLQQVPVADFSVRDSTLCAPAKVRFENASQHADWFTWRLQDSMLKTAESPKYTFEKPGLYDVQLVAASSEGCQDTLTKENYIKVRAKPEADFQRSRNTGCPPLTVSFNNQTKPDNRSYSYNWTMGTGDTLRASNPVYTYENGSSGTYAVILIADNDGCQDTAIKQVTIGGFAGETIGLNLTNVTVKDNQHIRLNWQPHPDGQQYQVQRQKPNSPWRNVATTDTSTYLDQTVNVQTQHYRYRIKGLDSCGNASLPSNTGRNILLEGESKGNESATLQWNPYQDWPQGVREYHLQKSGQPGNFERLTSTTDTTYQDQDYFNPRRDSQYYRVEAIRRGQPDIISTSNISALPFEARLFIPDAFSPNGDGINDTFRVNATGIFNYSLKVYNRWGELVYESNNPEAGWDGTYKGEESPTGVYFYTLYATGNYGKPISREGPVQLIR